MVKKFNDYIKENKSKFEYLYYYAFDLDDNILKLPTKVHMEKYEDNKWVKKDVSSNKYVDVKNDKRNWRLIDNDKEKAYKDFKDPKKFTEDFKSAIENKNYGPSWNDFIKCLTNGSLFAIITARSLNSIYLKSFVKYVIDKVLTDTQKNEMYSNLLKFSYHFDDDKGDKYDRILKTTPSENNLVKRYLSNCYYIGVNYQKTNNSSVKTLKSRHLYNFCKKINNYSKMIGVKSKIGFSDDDKDTIEDVEILFNNINKEKFPYISEYIIKNTYDSKNIQKINRVMETSNQSIGMESSVLKSTQFGNMTSTLYPKGPYNRQNDMQNQFDQKIKELSKLSKNIFQKKYSGKKKKKKKEVN
jgi:hypothetical protein